MSAPALPASVNIHYLSKVIDLAENMAVATTEDIFDAHGMKLVAKGTRVSAKLQEKLIVHKLKKPLESCIAVEGGVGAGEIEAAARLLLEANRPLARIVAASFSTPADALAILSGIDVGPAMTMMLTMTSRLGASALDHSIAVSLLGLSLARKLKLAPDEQRATAIAGLLHDVGELYINPAYLASGKRLEPREWSHVVSHPRVGQLLVGELAAYPATVGRAVAEHHERFDGSGYPRGLSGNAISAPGQALSVAEMIAGLMNKDHALERAELALKLIPGEHNPALLSGISQVLRNKAPGEAEAPVQFFGNERPQQLLDRIDLAGETARAIITAKAGLTPANVDIVELAFTRIQTVRRAFHSTGLDVAPDTVSDDEAGVLAFEQSVATREIQWRLRDIARDLALRLPTALIESSRELGALIDLLDREALKTGAALPSEAPAAATETRAAA